MSQEEYLLANQPSELERLRLQSQVWEPSGRQLLSKIGGGSGRRALDVGCGALGWLRILGEWVGPSGQLVGMDIEESLLDAARSFLEAEGITNVELVVDDLFDSKLAPQSFDLVHALPDRSARTRRRAGGLVPAVGQARWLTGSGGVGPGLVALQSPCSRGLATDPTALRDLRQAGRRGGSGLPELLCEIGIDEPEIDAHVIALKPGHPYLRLPLQFSAALESRLLETLSEDALTSLRRDAETELAEPGRWGTTFTLIQSWGRLEG